LQVFDARLTRWTARHAVTMLRISIGIVFLWFGVLKFFPGMSPAQDLAARTIEALSFGHVRPALSVPLLAILIGATVRGGMLIADPSAAHAARSMERDPA
jgi:uncharacterized membrane protein YphA (DoxX/SURF4 family)